MINVGMIVQRVGLVMLACCLVVVMATETAAAFVTGVGLQVRSVRKQTEQCRKVSRHIAKHESPRPDDEDKRAEELERQCVKDKWSDAQRDCFLDADDADGIDACMKKL